MARTKQPSKKQFESLMSRTTRIPKAPERSVTMDAVDQRGIRFLHLSCGHRVVTRVKGTFLTLPCLSCQGEVQEAD